MRKIEAYKTNDRKLFENAAEAKQHEKDCAFIGWYIENLENQLEYLDGEFVECENVQVWLRKYELKILDYLGYDIL